MLARQDFIELIFFTLGVLAVVLFDNGFFSSKSNKDDHISIKSALKRVCFYVFLAMLFGVWVYFKHSSKEFFDFTTGYFLEMALSVDNVFVFILIFDFFKSSNAAKQKILLFGVVGAFVLRGIFIFLGVSIVHKFHWVLLIFGIVLLLSALKILYISLKGEEEEEDISQSTLLKILSAILPIAPNYHGDRFFVMYGHKFHFSRAFLVLVFICFADVIFAVDSIPAIFSVTKDAYIIYTSNILAVLGLRSLYFVVDSFVDKFKYLKFGLAIVLLLIGIKLCLSVFFGEFMPSWSVLLISFIIFIASIVISSLKANSKPKATI
jgi:tellurite resistance protein TerC